MFCRQQVAQLRALEPELRRRGAQLVIIGNGAPEHAAAFAREQELEAVFTDPSCEIYVAAGFTRSLLASLSPRIAAKGLDALRSGFRQGAMRGSALQQGGVLVVDREGTLRARYASRFGGDHPSDAWILDALG
jgi:peroxiredoxin